MDAFDLYRVGFTLALRTHATAIPPSQVYNNIILMQFGIGAGPTIVHQLAISVRDLPLLLLSVNARLVQYH